MTIIPSPHSYEFSGLIHLLCAFVSISTGSLALFLSCNLLPPFLPYDPPTHQFSFCDSYGVDPTHCNFMLSGLESSLDLLTRSVLLQRFDLFCPTIGLRLHFLPHPFSLFTFSTFSHFFLAIPLLPTRCTYRRRFSLSYDSHLASLELGLAVVYHILVAFLSLLLLCTWQMFHTYSCLIVHDLPYDIWTQPDTQGQETKKFPSHTLYCVLIFQEKIAVNCNCTRLIYCYYTPELYEAIWYTIQGEY